jgi:hypothetical protein
MGGGSSPYSGPSSRSTDDSERIFRNVVDEKQTKLRNVFISFKVEDEPRVNLFRHQAREGLGVEFRDYSVKEPFDEKWKTNCRERIAQTSAVIVFVGRDTAKSKPVNWEIDEAYSQDKKVVAVRIYRDENNPLPESLVRHKTRVINWDNSEISKFLEKP